MPANITSVTISFENGLKREEYGPVKKAGASFTASVAENEDGTVVAAFLSHVAMARVAEMLSAPKPAVAEVEQPSEANQVASASGEAPARRTRGPNKAKTTAQETAMSAEAAASPAPTEESPEGAGSTEPDAAPAAEDEWAVSAEDIVITDQELLSSLSKRAQELGSRESCLKLVLSFSTRTEGPPFKVQEIPQNQRRDFLEKLAALPA